MRASITEELSYRLPLRSVEIRDTKLKGFVIRCRPSGRHSYLMSVGRGRTVTLGRAGDRRKDKSFLSARAAREAAETLKGEATKQTAAARAEDPVLTLGEAQAQARAAVVTARRERRDGAVTLGVYLADTYGPWVAEHRKTGDETLARLTSVFAGLLATPLATLSAFALERWRTARLKSGVTSATTNRDLAALRGALTKAVEWKKLATHPMETVKAAKTDPIGHIRYLSEAETTRLRAALVARDDRRRAARASGSEWRRERDREPCPAFGRYTDHLTPIVLLALNTGLRRGELLALRWRDVDLAGPLLTVRGADAKSGISRRLPLNAEAVAVLRAWRPAPADLNAPVFPGTNGEPLQEFKAAWLALMRAAKITSFRFHDTRHDFASKLVQAGTDLNVVRSLLGHATMTMTLRSAHLAPEQAAAAVAKLVRA